MATAKAPGRPKAAGGGARAPKPQAAPILPPITVAKFEETGRLLERTVAENQSLFIQKGQEFKEQHRQGSSRPLSALEAAQVAVAAGAENVPGMAEEVQASNLRAYDEPSSRDVLLAAGLATAAAIVEAFRRAVALVEMPNDVFKQARENGQLNAAIDAAATVLEDITIGELKDRTTAAMEHYATSAGFSLGEAMSLPVKAIWQALTSAIDTLQTGSPSSSLIDSAAPTTGPDQNSSTS